MTSGPSTATNGAPRAPLSRSAVLDAALRLVDEHGIDALSMRRLGKELGVEAMSLYNHVPNKAALLDGLVEQVINEIDRPPADAPWDDQVREMARSYRRLAHAHPNVVPLIAMRPFNTITALDPVEQAFGIFRAAGFDDHAALHAFRTLAGFATGYTLAETGSFFGETNPAEATGSLGGEDLDPERFPNLTHMLPTIANCDHDAEYEFGIDVIIEGLRTKLP
ncbi:MAG TPA: TetR/AcrR family transcriptional regulator C-terminal domain-containing protein [Actinomycetota bacterium]|nr:TetR/AcrR family transcriptional regulator C-terminal domain-containing protein [Actinomycetota bacterium]